MRRAAIHGALGLLLPLLATTAAGGAPAPPWWRTRFPPPAAGGGVPLPEPPAGAGRAAEGTACGSFDGVALTDGGAYLYGWAYDPRTGAPAAGVVVLDAGRRLAPPVHVFRERPDVAVAKGDPRLVASGWALWIPPHRLAAGRHAFAAQALLAGGGLCRLEGTHVVDKPAR